MADNIIPNENGRGFTFAFKSDDVEYVDPIAYLQERTVKTRFLLYKNTLSIQHPTFPKELIENTAIKKANEAWIKHFKEISDAIVPPNLILLLNASTKKEQINLLKTVSLTPHVLWAFIFKSYSDFGFKYSQYKSEHFHNVEKESLPKLATLNRETGEIRKVGKTKLTDGQIKQAIEQRKVVVTKFLDKDSNWHAFFITYRSIAGEESGQMAGQPHFHYISNKFQITREKAVASFKSNHYPKTSVHIKLLDYGNQPIDKT